jgi:RNA polymerase primary sigma factor
MEDVRAIPEISSEEEYELALKVKEGCVISKDTLVKSNLRFVISVAKMYQRNNSIISLEDLINEGNLGMIEAADKFDPSLGFKFISFAVWHIRRRIRECISKNSRQIKLPENQIQSAAKIGKIQTSYVQKFDRFPTPYEIQNELLKLENPTKMTIESINRILGEETRTISLESSSPEDSDYSPINYIGNSDDMESITRSDSNIILNELFKPLNNMEIQIISMKLGLPPYSEVYSNKQIADRLGLAAQETIRKKAFKILRKIKVANPALLNKLNQRTHGI